MYLKSIMLLSERTTGPTLPWGLITPPPTFVFPSVYPGSSKRIIFDGRTWYIYDLSHLPQEFLRPNREEKMKIHFFTNNPDGLLWFNGDPTNNVHLVLKVGDIIIVMPVVVLSNEFLIFFVSCLGWTAVLCCDQGWKSD